MPERMTLDLDILIKAEDASKTYQDLENAGSKKIGILNIPGSQWQLSDNTSLKVLEGDDEWVTVSCKCRRGFRKSNYLR